jgi:hypothetical protein
LGVRIGEQWNRIHRVILPVIFPPAPVDMVGPGDTQNEGFASSANPSDTTW